MHLNNHMQLSRYRSMPRDSLITSIESQSCMCIKILRTRGRLRSRGTISFGMAPSCHRRSNMVWMIETTDLFSCSNVVGVIETMDLFDVSAWSRPCLPGSARYVHNYILFEWSRPCMYGSVCMAGVQARSRWSRARICSAFKTRGSDLGDVKTWLWTWELKLGMIETNIAIN